jgi:AhpD family alkylhydroperoxidase
MRTRVILWLLAIPNLFVGLWAGLAPHSWYSHFPGFGRHWIVTLGPFDEHLTRDFGFALVALGLLLAWAAANPRAPIKEPALTALLVFSVPHLVYHLATLDELPRGDTIANLFLLTGSVALPLFLLVSPRSSSQPRAAAAGRHGADGNGQARLEGVRESEAGPFLRLSYWITRRRYGKLLDPLTVTAHHPGILRGYVAYELAIERATRVDDRLKDLAATAAALMVGCRFCIDFASALLQKSGLSDEQLRELPRYNESSAFSPDEKLVMQYAEVLTSTPVVMPEGLFEELQSRFDEAELVELTATITFENYRARFNHAFGIGEQGFAGEACQVLLQSSTDSDTVAESRKDAAEVARASSDDAARVD